MHVSDLSLEDFRSYRRLVVSLEPGVTALIGPNGQGKTNLIEAVDYLSGLSSHRAGADTALVRRAGPGATHLSLPSMKRPLTIRPSLVMIGSASSILSSRDAPR